MVLDGSLIYDKIVLPQREADRLKRRPDESPLDGIYFMKHFNYFFSNFFLSFKFLHLNDLLARVQAI